MPLRIGHWIKGWRLDKFFKKMFASINEEAKILIPAVIAVTNKWKEFIDSPVADLLTAIIPGNLDDNIKNKLREKLPGVLEKLQLAYVIANISDPNEQLKAILDILKLSSDEAKNAFYHEFSYTFLEAVSDGKVTMSEAKVLAEMVYQYKYKNPA